MTDISVERVTATPAALALVAMLQKDYGPVLFHQSGGCCDGSSPMCYPQSDFTLGDHDVRLGEVGGAPFYISRSQYEYWKHTQLIIDVVPGRGGMFSLENGRDLRFLTRSRLFTDDELRWSISFQRGFGRTAVLGRVAAHAAEPWRCCDAGESLDETEL
jgi:uncharacterized protein (DUF779 family)